MNTKIVTFLGLIILIASGAFLAKTVNQKKKAPVNIPPKHLEFVEKKLIKLSNNQVFITKFAFIKAKQLSKISSQVAGNINYVNPQLEVGNIIEKGVSIIKIDDTNYLSAKAGAKANLTKALTNLAIEKAKSKQAKKDLSRAGIKASRLSLRKPQLELAKANVNSAKAALIKANKDISRTNITTPFKAIIISKNISTSELVGMGTPLVQLAALDTFIAEIDVSESDLKLISKQTKPKVYIYDQTNNQTWESRITRFSPVVNKKTRSLTAFAEINNPYEKNTNLKLESFVKVKIYSDTYPNSMWIDNVAIATDEDDNKSVWVMDKSNKLKKLSLKLISSKKGKSLVQFLFIKTYDSFIKNSLPIFEEGVEVTTKKEVQSKKMKAGHGH